MRIVSILAILLACVHLGPVERLCSQSVEFIRADSNDDGRVDISDPVATLNCLFAGGLCHPCPDAPDANDDAKLDISDAVFTLNHLFLGGPEPPAPYPGPGFDGTSSDDFTCGDPPLEEPGDVIISEIHYHPLVDQEEEFIELHNRSSRPVDLEGWKFTKGVDFTFGAVTLEPGGYLVVARNAAKITAKYGIGNVVGNWGGILDDGGESIRLRDAGGTTINEVAYDDGGGLWPREADGYGSSLELIDLHGTNFTHGAWAASDEASKSEWTPFQINGAAAGGSSELHVLLVSQGECLVDNLQVVVGGQNRLANGSFESNMTGWLAQGTHRLSTAESNSGAVEGSRVLHLVATGRGDTSVNRIECDLTSAVNSGQAVSIRGWARWLFGSRYLLLRLHGNAVAQSVELDVPEDGGTPGLPNSTAIDNRGPDVESVSHFPVLPGATQQVRITGVVSDVDGVASVDLAFSVDGGAVQTRPMFDDGTNGDATEGDEVYTAMIPAQSAGRIVSFWITAADLVGAEGRFPFKDPERCHYRTGEPNPTSQFDRFHIWMPPETVAGLRNAPKMSNEMFDITFVLNNTEIFYNAKLRYRGSPFIRATAPTDPVGGRYAYRIDFGEHQLMKGKAETNLDNLEPGRDPTIQREKAAYVFHEQIGLPWSRMDYVRVWFNGNDHGIYADVQKIDNDYVKVHWPADDSGDLHKVDDYFEFDDGGGFSNRDARLTNYGARKEEYRWNFERRDEDRNDEFGPLQELTRLMNVTGPAYEQSVELAIDAEQWARALAARRIIGDWDSFGYRRGKNNYLYRPRLEGRWKIVPWDMDFLLGNGDGPTSSLFGGLDPAVDRFLDYPKYKKMYLKAFRDLVEGPFRVEYIGPILDATYDQLRREASVADPSSIKSYVTSRRNYILSQLPSATLVILTNGGNDFSTSETSVTIEGDAPLEVESFRLNGAPLSVTIAGISKWSFTRSIPLGETTFTVEGRDAGGTVVGTDSITMLRVPPCVPGSVEPSTLASGGTRTITLHGSGFAPGSTPVVRITSASEEPGFNAFYAEASGPWGDVDGAAAFLNNPAGAIRTLETTHLTISRRTEGDGEIFPTQPFPSPWNTGAVNNLAARYTGYINVPTAGNRTFGVHSDDGFRLRINGAVVCEYPQPRGPDTTLGTYNFPTAGSFPIQLDWYENGGGDIVQFFQESTGGSRNLVNQGSEAAVTRDDPIIFTATDVVVVDDSTITAEIDLTGAPPGVWSVVVTPEQGSVCRLTDGLTVE